MQESDDALPPIATNAHVLGAKNVSIDTSDMGADHLHAHRAGVARCSHSLPWTTRNICRVR
jgi:hypothetical protein